MTNMALIVGVSTEMACIAMVHCTIAMATTHRVTA